MKVPRWQRERAGRQRKKFGRLIKLLAGCLIFSLLIWTGLVTFKTVKTSNLPRAGRVTVIFPSSPVVVVSSDPGRELIVLLIPEKTYVETVHGFGSYRIGTLWQLGQLESPVGQEGQLLLQTTQELLGVPIDGWIGPKNGRWPISNNKEEILKLKNELTSWKILLRPKEILTTLRSLRTNLTLVDLTRLWLIVKKTRFDKVNFVDLEKTKALSPLVLADGSQALTSDPILIDAVCAGLFKDSQAVNEHLLIEILNGTERPGLANRALRFITNLGAQAGRVGNSSPKVSFCQIKGENQFLESFTAQRLAQIFECQISNQAIDSRADLQLVIGEDYWQKLYQR